MFKISVAMSVHNEEKHLRQSIESILNQTYKKFEFIICDDASTDTSVEIIKEYMQKDDRIVLLQNNKNLGLAASLNKCISISKGELIARMDADDISFIDRFEKQTKFLDKHQEVAFVCGGVYLFDEKNVWGKIIGKTPLTLETVYKHQPISHPTVMVRKKVLNEVGGYTVAPYTRRGQDFDLWCKIYQKGYIGKNIEEYVLYYRDDAEAYKRRKFKNRVDSYFLKKRWRRELGLPVLYELYAYKSIIAGLIPKYIMKKYHILKFNNKNKKNPYSNDHANCKIKLDN